MSVLEVLPEPIVKQPSRRVRTLRATSAGLIVLALFYVTLPVWMPVGWIRARITQQLADDLQRPVVVGDMRVSWREGVVLEGLAISDHAGAPNPLLARVGRIRFALTPLLTILTNRVRQIEISDAQLWIVRNEQGRLNVDDFGDRHGGRLPSLDYVLEKAACHVWTPTTRQTFRIDRLECRLEPPTGLLRLFGQAVVTRPATGSEPASTGRFNLHARLHVPRLKRDEDLRGEIRAEWSNLSLTDLPLVLIPRLPIEQVSGSTGGTLRFATQPDLTIDYGLTISLNGVKVMREGLAHPAQVPDAELRGSGRWDPNPRSDILVLDDFAYETPALHIRRAGGPTQPTALIDHGSETQFRLNMEGRVKDWALLRREFPEIDELARSVRAELAGSADFQLEFTQQREEDRVRITLDGRDSDIRIAKGDDVAAPHGLPKSVILEVLHNRVTRQLSVPDARITLGDLEATMRNEIDVPDPEPGDWLQWLSDTLPTLQSAVSIHTPRLEQAVEVLPLLARIEGATEWRGPALITASVQPEQGVSRIKLSLSLDPQTTFRVADLLNKPAGVALSIDAGGLVPHDANGTLGDFWLDAAPGTGRLLVGQGKAKLDYRFTPGERDGGAEATTIDAVAEVPVRIERLESILPLLPFWQRNWPAPLYQATGTVDVLVRTELSYRPDDWVIRNQLEVVADALGTRWGGWFQKEPGTPLKVTASHRSRLVEGTREQSLSARVVGPAAELSGALTFAGADSLERSDDFEQIAIRADILDAATLARSIPGLASTFSALKPAGALSLRAESLLTGGRQTLSLSADATQGAFQIPGDSPLDKTPGTPATLAMRWETDIDGGKEGEQHWQLTAATARLGGAEIKELSGELVGSWRGGAGGGLSRQVFAGDRQAPRLVTATFDAAGTLHVGKETRSLHRLVRGWVDQYGLSGDSAWSLRLRASPDAVDVSGQIDADRTNLLIALPGDLAPLIRKTPRTPADVRFDLSFVKSEEGGYGMNARDVRVAIDGNSFSAAGDVQLQRSRDGGLSLGDVTLRMDTRLDAPRKFLALLPGTPVRFVDGKLAAELRYTRLDGESLLHNGRIEFSGFEAGVGDLPLHLDGRLLFNQYDLDIEQLRWGWGRSGGVASASLRKEGEGREGEIGLSFDRLDLDDLRARIASVAGAGRESAGDEMNLGTRAVLRELARSNLVVDANFSSVDLRLPLDVTVSAQAAGTHVEIENGPIHLQFHCLVDGGVVTGTFETNAEAADPAFHLAYRADRIQPGRVVDTYLDLTFPGMTATGPLTLIDESNQKLLPQPDEANYPTGRGEIIIDGGFIEGRAAPVWVTRLFPGLNFARFDFLYMHSWFEKFADGRIRHQMIYQGPVYNIYMIGDGEPDGHIDYEVGIDFFADFDSKYWAEVGQGRVPLFRKTGHKLPDGRLVDEVVTYVPPQRIFTTLFVKNNPLVTAYHAVRKRVLKKQ